MVECLVRLLNGVGERTDGVCTADAHGDAQAGVFAGLGHPISDSDTGERVALRSGEIVACQIVGCTGGTAGSPGELKGKFISDHALGRICINGENGVYGTVSTAIAGQQTEIAFAQEVLPGAAEILTTTSGETPRSYRVYIEKVNDADPRRNMVLRVTDPALLAEKAQDHEAVRAAMDRLPEQVRLILSLRAVEDMSYQEIGTALELPAGTVKSRISRAREKIRRQLDGNLFSFSASDQKKGGRRS